MALVMPKDEKLWNGEFDLRAFDFLWTNVPNVPVLYRFGVHLDPEILVAGLQRALDVFPILAGRLKQGSRRGRPFFVKVEPGMGVSWEVQGGDQHDISSSNGDGFFKKRLSWLRVTVASFTTKQEELEDDENPRYYPTGHGPFLFPHEPLFDFGPLFSAKLTVMRNGESVLGISFVHCVSDLSSILHFLRTWSYFCGECAGFTPLPRELPPPPELDRNYKVLNNKNMEQILETKNPEKGSSSYQEFVQVLLKTVPTFFSDVVKDLVIQQEDLTQMKTAVCERLASQNEWVSSYELLYALLLKTMVSTEHEFGQDLPDPMVSRCVINTRERGDHCTEHYYGNGIHLLDLSLGLDEALAQEDWLASLSLELHQNIRTALKDPELLDSLHYQTEAGLRQGLFDSYIGRIRYTKIYSDNVMQRATTLYNSWLPFDFFGMDFGSNGFVPYRVHVAKSWCHRNYFLVFPRDNERKEFVVRTTLPKEKSHKFIQHLATQIKFQTM